MQTRIVTYSDAYQHTLNQSVAYTRAGLIIDALGLAELHGDLEDHYESMGGAIGYEQRRLGEMLSDVEELAAGAVL